MNLKKWKSHNSPAKKFLIIMYASDKCIRLYRENRLKLWALLLE